MKARIPFLILVATVGLAGAASAQAPRKRPMDHSVYEVWDTIGAPALSPDGAWAHYSLIGYDRDGELRVRATAGQTEHAIDRGGSARFAADSRFAIFTISPMKEEVKKAKREKRKEMPRDSIGILDLQTGEIVRIADVKSFRVPEKAGGWVAYHLADWGEKPADTSGADESKAANERPAAAKKDRGTPLVIRELATGAERRYENVVAYAFTADGKRLAYAASTGDGDGDGVYVVDVASGTTTAVLTGAGAYRQLTWDDRGEQLAFLTTRDDVDAKQPSHSLYHWRAGATTAKLVAQAAMRGIPDGWWISEHGNLSFSRDGRRLFFGTAPRPEPEPEDDTLPEDRVKVDIWHWQDPLIQPMQHRRLAQERRRSYLAVVHLRDGRIVQLADPEVATVAVGAKGDADVAIGTANAQYAYLIGRESPGYSDVYLIDVRNGKREQILEGARSNVTLSPGARYAAWFDPVEKAWFALDVRNRKAVNLTAGIPFPLYNEDFDTPTLAPPYGVAGWTDGDAALLVYDRHDVWALDPTGKRAPQNVTEGVGRRENLRFRYVRLDREQDMIDASQPILLSAFHYRTKAAGFYRDRVRGNAEPERLVFSDHAYSAPIKAEQDDVVLYTRSSFQEFPDLWVAGTDFSAPRRISAANPQQAEYLWGTAELVEWTSTDGVPLQGILYKPEDFDPSKKYPMIVYFYERMSDGLHAHYAPVPHRSRINFTFYTSRGYLVFVPDIVYKTGYPGESAMNAVMPGVLKLLGEGFVDEDRLALQGHSWGGYQIAYMVTKTNLFKVGAAGAPVANMTSAYGGIRWETGMSRQFQYERTQSRLGGTLWEMPIRYIENSPLFWLDKVETPLLVMHNDQDGAVPWYQGIELYMGLRRLGKPVWLINYNDEPHWPTTAANKRDWNIRMQQFFDHYLKDEPAPVWLAEGVPASKKGRTLGLEPAETAPRPAADAQDR